MTLLQNTTLAQSQSQQSFSDNLSAISKLQPDLITWIQEQHLPVEWVFARDRTLTALDEAGQWFSGCSLPTRATEAMLARLEPRGAVVCMLTPPHAAHVRIALQRLRSEQAIIVVAPDLRNLATILHCDNFSADISAHRLWFVAGPAWEISLRRLFESYPGLATPLQFIRSPDVDRAESDDLITAAQKVFSDVSQSRSSQIQAIRSEFAISNARSTPRVCVVAGSNFRLWNDIGQSMLGIFSGVARTETYSSPSYSGERRGEGLASATRAPAPHPSSPPSTGERGTDVIHFDADDPACSSPLALLQACRGCDAIFTPNTVRSDLPGLIPDQLPWITWATTARVPSSPLTGKRDQLIVIDPKLKDLAVKAGWNASRVHLGAFPAPLTTHKKDGADGLGILVDTHSLATPEDLVTYSSHSLLWEAIRHELSQDPFVLLDAPSFLTERMKRMGVGEEAFPFARFIEKLILPAYQQGLARTLIRAGAAVRLYGAGWDALSEFQPFAAGDVGSREQFHQAIGSCAALVHVWPSSVVHPIDFCGVPVIRRTNRRPQQFLREALAAASGKPPISAPLSTPSLSYELLRGILKSVLADAR